MSNEYVGLPERVTDIEKKMILLEKENSECAAHWEITRKLERKFEVMETNAVWARKTIENKLNVLDEKLEEIKQGKKDRKIYLFYAGIVGSIVLLGNILIKVL